MGSSFSKAATNKEVMSPGVSNPGGLNVVEEIHLGEETDVNMEESKITMEEPTSGTGEMSGQSNNQKKDKVRKAVKRANSALQQNAKKPKKERKGPMILVFYYRTNKKRNQNLPDHKEETLQKYNDENNAL